MVYVFIALFLVLQSLEALGTPNVGTVLFSREDLNNDTWNTDDVALLRARLYFQHLVPPFLTPQTPNYVETLLKYFKNGYLSISKESVNMDMDRILTLAFTDVIGGYMKTFALPVAKYAYYGGTLPKRDTLKLFLFYEDLKNYLGKNGSGWAPPDFARLDTVTINVALPQIPLVRSMMHQDPCYRLSYFEKTPIGLSIPTPKIDWDSRTMFVPLANESLVDLHSTNGTDALLKFYTAASNCLLSAIPNKLDNFNHRFQLWLQEDVMPHLNDDRLYAPLQGVLSLVNNTYDAEAYQNLMRNLDLPNSRSGCGHSRKMKIIIAIVLFEIICCVPTLLYLCCKGRSGSRGSSSRVNMIYETRSGKSFSDYGLRSTKSSHVKRHGGLKMEQKPIAVMEAGEMNTWRSLHSMGTDMNELLPEGYEDMATMVDEFFEHRRRTSFKDVQTLPQDAVVRIPVKDEVSDDTGKTVTLSSNSGPTKTTTVKISRQTKKPSGPTVPSNVIKPTLSPTRRLLPKHSRLDPKKELRRESVKVKQSAIAKNAELFKSEIFKETIALKKITKDLVAMNKKVASRRSTSTEKKSATFKLHKKEKSIKIQGGDNPYVEITIDRPQLEILSTGILRKEERKSKELCLPPPPRLSRIPTRHPQLKALDNKPPIGSTPRESLHAPKSLIPIKKRPHDDSYLNTSMIPKVDKLNVTL